MGAITKAAEAKATDSDATNNKTADNKTANNKTADNNAVNDSDKESISDVDIININEEENKQKKSDIESKLIRDTGKLANLRLLSMMHSFNNDKCNTKDYKHNSNSCIIVEPSFKLFIKKYTNYSGRHT